MDIIYAMEILYEVGNNLYVNLTNRCSCNCVFCLRNSADAVGSAGNLWLEKEPSFDDVVDAFASFDIDRYNQVVFCGYGEPTEAFTLLMRVALYVKLKFGKPIRINTNGHGNLINGRNIVPEMEGLIDSLSISLNTPDASKYLEMTQCEYGEQSHQAMLDFAKEAAAVVPDVTMTTVETVLSAEEEDACRKLCEELGVRYRIRPWVD